jgi:hypothetical protein
MLELPMEVDVDLPSLGWIGGDFTLNRRRKQTMGFGARAQATPEERLAMMTPGKICGATRGHCLGTGYLSGHN